MMGWCLWIYRPALISPQRGELGTRPSVAVVGRDMRTVGTAWFSTAQSTVMSRPWAVTAQITKTSKAMIRIDHTG